MGDVDIQVAVMVADRRDVKKYINAGGDLEVKDEDAATPLFHAAFWTHVDVARDLVNAGANVNAQRNDGFTPLHVAVKNNQPRMTDVLVKAMSSLSIQEEYGDTALHWAYRSKAVECIEILLAAGADPEVLNHMGKTPKECEGTGVDRQDDNYDDNGDDDDGNGRPSPSASDALSAGDASTVVGDTEIREEFPRKSPSRPSDGRSAATTTSPRTCRNRSGTSTGGSAAEPEEPHRAHFRVSHPPNIKAGGRWHFITAYLFEPVASRAVRQAHQARVSGDRRAFASDDTVEDGDRAIPPGTEVIIRPRFPRTCCVNPVQATVKWLKDVHTVSFEVRPPPSAASGCITGSIEFYVGAMLLGQSQVEMTVVTSSDSAEAADVLGPVTKVFDTAYVCFAAPDEPLLLPSLERFKNLGIAGLSWRPDHGGEKETKALIREASVFQICWSQSAQVNSRVKNELKYASSLAKAGSVAVRGIYWDPSMAVTSIKTDHGLAFPVRLHNSFLLEEPCVVLARATNDTSVALPTRNADTRGQDSRGNGGAVVQGKRIAREGAGEVLEAEKLCTAAVDNTRGHVSRLRDMVGDADALDVPRLMWLYPDDGGKAGSVDLTSEAWLKKPIRLAFLCPVSMKPGRCGEDGKGYKLTLPRGWARNIGIALKIGVLFVAAASDVGEVADLPVPACGTNRGVDGRHAAKFSSAEWQGDVVNAAYDGLAGAVDVKSNDLIDSAFMDADTEGSPYPTPSAQLCKEATRSYVNLLALLQKHDKGLKMTGLVRVSDESGKNSEWVHPSVAQLYGRHGPAVFERGVLAAAAATAAREARYDNGESHGSNRRGEEKGQAKKGKEMMDTIRLLQDQVMSMMEGPGSCGA